MTYLPCILSIVSYRTKKADYHWSKIFEKYKFMAKNRLLKRIIGFGHTVQVVKLLFWQIQHLVDLKIPLKYQNSLMELSNPLI